MTTEVFHVPLGRNIKRAREFRRLTQTKLGKAVGVTKQTVSQWENGRQPPSLTNLLAVATVLDVDILDLLKGVRFDPAIHEPETEEEQADGASCSGCRFYHRSGSCRRHAPKDGAWPLVGSEDWCGDYEGRDAA